MQAGTKKQYRIPLFCLVATLFWFSLYTYVPILAAYVEQLGASHKMAGVIVGSYGFTQMLLRIPVGIISDKIHKRRLFISFGLFFAFFSGLGLWLTKDLNVILLFRSLAGAAAATWVDFTILFTSYYEHGKATEAVGVVSFYSAIGQMLGMLAGSWMVEVMDWQAPFGFGAAVGVIALVLSFFLVDNFEEGADKITLNEMLNVIKDRTLITVSSLAILAQILTFATVYGFTPVFAGTLGISKFEMGLLTVFSTLPTAFASVIVGKYLVRRFDDKKIVVWGFVLTGIFTVTIPFTRSFWLLIATQILAGAGRGFSFTILMGLSIKDVESNKRATAMGFFQAIYGLGMFMGPVIMGLLGDAFNLAQGFIVLGSLGCLTALLSQWTVRNSARDTASS